MLPLQTAELHRARVAASLARGHAAALDEAGAAPAADIVNLRDAGLLAAPLPPALGGAGLGAGSAGAARLARVLEAIGYGSLPLGRIYEGHVNAVLLVLGYGRAEQIGRVAKLVCDGALLAVWNTQTEAGGVTIEARAEGLRLHGAKTHASGAGLVAHPLITARDAEGALYMVIPEVASQRADLSSWDPGGMRASASGTVDFTDIAITRDDIFGAPDDFHRQPMFSAGAWRFAAVQTGGIAAVYDAARAHLEATARMDDPHQLARMGRASIALESARLWVRQAALHAADEGMPGETRVAYVNLARSAVERAGLDVLEAAQRSVGLAGAMRSHPLERLSRDLATYLRQPNPDKALCEGAALMLRDGSDAFEPPPWA